VHGVQSLSRTSTSSSTLRHGSEPVVVDCTNSLPRNIISVECVTLSARRQATDCDGGALESGGVRRTNTDDVSTQLGGDLNAGVAVDDVAGELCVTATSIPTQSDMFTSSDEDADDDDDGDDDDDDDDVIVISSSSSLECDA